MIDLLIVKGALGSPQPHHLTCLSLVSFSRFLQTKAKITTTYVNSPLTGAQMEVKYWVESDLGISTAYLEVSIPLASATMGHNYAHAGLTSILLELKCASLLTRITLAVLGFLPDEVKRFMGSSETQLLELTWHTNTASERARRSLQKRSKAYFDGQKSVSSRHDISISDVDHRDLNGQHGLLVSLKNGDQFRQYAKVEHLASRLKSNRKQSRILKEVRPQMEPLLAAITNHVRNELLIGAKTFKHFECQNPRSWDESTLASIIDHLWNHMGLALSPSINKLFCNGKALSPEANETWQRYLLGETLSASLPASTFTRHRRAIRQSKGVDIAIKRIARSSRPDRLGNQLSYFSCWEPVGELRQLVLCEETAPAIIEELQRGLAFLADGVIPDLVGEQSRDAWKNRWVAFREREGGHKKNVA